MSGAIPPLFHVPSWYKKNYKFLYVYFTLRWRLSTHVCNFCKMFTFISSQSLRLHENHSIFGLAK